MQGLAKQRNMVAASWSCPSHACLAEFAACRHLQSVLHEGNPEQRVLHHVPMMGPKDHKELLLASWQIGANLFWSQDHHTCAEGSCRAPR